MLRRPETHAARVSNGGKSHPIMHLGRGAHDPEVVHQNSKKKHTALKSKTHHSLRVHGERERARFPRHARGRKWRVREEKLTVVHRAPRPGNARRGWRGGDVGARGRSLRPRMGAGRRPSGRDLRPRRERRRVGVWVRVQRALVCWGGLE